MANGRCRPKVHQTTWHSDVSITVYQRCVWKTVAGSCDSAAENRQPPKNVEHRRPTTRREQPKQPTENVVQSIQSAFPSVCPDIYRMDCFLTRWRQHTFLVKWPDATTTWEPRKHIIDKKELSKFEEHWQGLDAGVDVLEVRLRAGKRPHLLHLHGRPSKEDTWVDEKYLSANLLGRI